MKKRPGPGATHGLVSTYRVLGCRCNECTDANTIRSAEERQRRSQVTAQYGLPSHVEHGVSAYNNWGCRCDVCRDAARAYNRPYRQAYADRQRTLRTAQ